MTKDEMEALIQTTVKGWHKMGYRVPSPVIKVCLYMHLSEAVQGPCIFDAMISAFAKIPEKARGWFIRRVMEVGKEIFGDKGCEKVAGTYYQIKQSTKDKRWSVGVAMIERYWLGKGVDAKKS